MASKPKAFMVRTGVVQQTNRWVSCAHEFQVNMYKFWGFIICDVCDFLFNCKNCFSDSSEVYNQKGKFLPSSSFCFPWCFLSSLLFRFFPYLLGFQHTDGEQEEPGDDCISSSLRAEDAGLCFDLLEGPRCRDVNGRKLSRNSNVCLFQVLVVSKYWAP